MSSEAALPNPRIFYGWFVVSAAFAVTFVGFGCAYTFSAFVESLQRDFGASRGSVSLVFSLAGFLYFGLGIVSGPLADRFGSRRHAGDGETAGAEAIGEGTADDPKAEVKKAGEREHQRHRAARGAEIPLQRFDEG